MVVTTAQESQSKPSLFLASINYNVCQQAKRTGEFLIIPVSKGCSPAGLLIVNASVDWRASWMMLNLPTHSSPSDR
jgi:hypothetical protein